MMENFRKLRKEFADAKSYAEENNSFERKWRFNDSPLNYFGETFIKCIPEKYIPVDYIKKSFTDPPEILTREYNGVRQFVGLVDVFGEIFRNYIETTLANGGKKPFYAVELCGQGSKLFSQFSEGFFNKTAGLCLKDARFLSEKEFDKITNHVVIPGNVFDNQTYLDLQKELGVEKVDLIIQKGMASAKEFSKKQPMLSISWMARKLYDMLNDNGIIFYQFDYFPEHDPGTPLDPFTPEINEFEKVVIEWTKSIQEKYPEIEIQIARGVLRLHKKPGAPKKLPKNF